VANIGHGLQVVFPHGGLSFAGESYDALQLHMHVPSEHALKWKNGTQVSYTSCTSGRVRLVQMTFLSLALFP
jgi:hypothetical protein